jgi:hypothetical protein
MSPSRRLFASCGEFANAVWLFFLLRNNIWIEFLDLNISRQLRLLVLIIKVVSRFVDKPWNRENQFKGLIIIYFQRRENLFSMLMSLVCLKVSYWVLTILGISMSYEWSGIRHSHCICMRGQTVIS